MKKTLIVIVFLGLIVFSATTASAQFQNGEAAIFLTNGGVIIDHIVDISSARLVLETRNSGEFALSNIWMINYENDAWDFPNERDQMTTNEHYIFLRNGNIITGRIIDFSSAQIIYELAAGGQVAPANILRIYFSKNVPAGLGGANLEGLIAGIYRAQGTQLLRASAVDLALNKDGSARLTVVSPSGQEARTLIGRWELSAANKSILIVRLGDGAQSGQPAVMTFSREGKELVGLNYDQKAYGKLRLKRD
jgi:hypothetical protein